VVNREGSIYIFHNMIPLKCFIRSTVLAGCVCVASVPMAHAVIVAGANGGANNSNNTTRAQLEALPTVSDGFYFDNVFTYRNGNAVYIGYDPVNQFAYALTAMHLGTQATLTIQSITYNIQDRISIGGSDLALLRLTQAGNIMPSLQAVTLASTALVNNTAVVMIGNGRSRVQGAATDANTSDAVAVTDGTGYTTSTTRQKRWGTNTTSNFGPPSSPTETFNILGLPTVTGRTVFNQPGSGEWLTSNQAQAVTNDSGGGVFSHNGILLGIMVAVQAPDATQARFGNTTLFANIATYQSAIESETGLALIPEPTSALLFLMSLPLLMQRRIKPR